MSEMAALIVLLLLLFLLRAWGRRWADETLRGFVAAFPGRCPICAYHRYGLQEGHTRKLRPASHSCLEEDVD